LVHFNYARLIRGAGYELTTDGKFVLELLNSKRYRELRREMVKVHLITYDNLRLIVDRHIELGSIFSPLVEVGRLGDGDYLVGLLKPTFKSNAATALASALNDLVEGQNAKKVESALRAVILNFLFSQSNVTVPLFRSMSDRLISLRLLNTMKTTVGGCEFAKSYSPCTMTEPTLEWQSKLEVSLRSGHPYTIFLSDPDMEKTSTQQALLQYLEKALASLPSQAGYYDLPDVRDFVCESMRIPETAFDEGVNVLLDRDNPPVTVGLMYERISGRRKPMVRSRGPTQVFNLIRSA